MLLMAAALGALLLVLLGATLRQGLFGVVARPNIQTGSTGSDAVPETAGAEIVAYIQRGDVWIKTLPDGEPRRVTDDDRATTPRLSPSGAYVAYLQADDLLVTDIARGETTRIDTRGGAGKYAWSPTNDHLASITGDGGLRFTLMATGQTTEIAAGAESIMSGLVASSLAWSPDGRWLAYDLHGVRTEGDSPSCMPACGARMVLKRTRCTRWSALKVRAWRGKQPAWQAGHPIASASCSGSPTPLRRHSLPVACRC